ncbi:MAG: CmpA/NrtA family ABC transporter substrate-binding protein [Gammaproteobacteria bacterium]
MGSGTPRLRSIALCALMLAAVCARPHAGEPEKPDLHFGFVKLTDCAPLVVAYERGYFEDEGLYVTLEAQANWKIVLDRVIDGSLDGSHMLPGQVLGASAGVGTQAELIAPIALGLNTLAITLGRDVWAAMAPGLARDGDEPAHPIAASALKPVVAQWRRAGKAFAMGMVFPTSTHNYLLRYWLAAGGLHPGYYDEGDASGQSDAEVLLSVTPPPQMPATLEAGTIAGFSVGEPWNQQAARRRIGVPVVTAGEIWGRTPEKVLGLRADFATRHPETTRAILRALIRASMWLDDEAHREALVALLSRPEYVGADAAVLRGPLSGTYRYADGDERPLPDANRYFAQYASYPFRSDAIWYLTQMRRWGQIAQPQADAWYHAIATRTYRPDLYRAAASELIAAGAAPATMLPADPQASAPAAPFIDGIDFDASAPNAYPAKFPIGLKDVVATATPAGIDAP